MRLRYINTSTSLPVDETLERHLYRVMGAATADWLFGANLEELSWRRMVWDIVGHYDVLFVSATELERERERVGEDADLLGLYFPCHPNFGRPLIMVSPEKIMQAGFDLLERPGVALPLEEVFPLLLSGVVMHELGHWIMDERQDFREDCRLHWSLVLRDSIWRGRGQKGLPDLQRPYPGCKPAEHQPSRGESRHHHVVEESLCNALKLAGRLMPEERTVLEEFVRHAPPAYRAGLAWQMPEASVLEAMLAWRRHKETLRDLRHHWSDLLPTSGSPADCLSQALLAGTKITQPVDFERDLAQFVAAQLPAMVQAWQHDTPQYDAALNGVWGVYYWLYHKARSQADKSRWLAEWATRGPTGAQQAADIAAKAG